MPLGYLWTTVVSACCTAAVLFRPRPAHSRRLRLSFVLGHVIGEAPLPAAAWLGVATAIAVAEGDLRGPGAAAALALAAATEVGLAVVARRALPAGEVVARALDEALRPVARPVAAAPRRLLRALLVPLPLRPRTVERIGDVAYGPAGRRHRLDVYRRRDRPRGRPVVVYFHGGGFRMGGKRREGRALLHRLAAAGWVCVSANYRLSPAAGYREQLADVRRVLAWVREHAAAHGGDASQLLLAGSSAGAHLAATAALTADAPVAGVVCLYGYYGPAGPAGAGPVSPLQVLRPDAPPFFVTHGTDDTIVVVDDARDFVARLRAVSASPVVYAELPGAQHAFDLLASPRCEAVVDGIEVFAAWALERAPAAAPPSPAAAPA